MSNSASSPAAVSAAAVDDDRDVTRDPVQVDIRDIARARRKLSHWSIPVRLGRYAPRRCAHRYPTPGPRSSIPRPVGAAAQARLPPCSTRSPVSTRRRDPRVGRRRRPGDPSRATRSTVVTVSSPAAATARARGRGRRGRRDGVLAIVPLGAGNDFARQLDIPRDDYRVAIDLLRTGHVVAVDLGRVHTADGVTTWFTTVAHRLRRRGEPLGEHASPGSRHPALRRWRCCARSPRTDRVASASPSTTTHGRDRSLARRRRQHPDLRGRHDDHARGERSTTGCSTLRGRRHVTRADFLRTSRRCFAARTSTIRRCAPCPRRAGRRRGARLRRLRPVDLWPSGEHVGPLPARIEPVAGALAVVVPAPPAT